MSSQQYSRALLTTLAALRSAARHQIQRQSHTCAHSRSLSLAAAARQQLAHVESPRPGSGVTAASTGTTSLHLEFCDGRRSAVPYSWLRDNCQCHKCNGNYSSLRNPTSPFQVTVHPEIIQSNVFGVVPMTSPAPVERSGFPSSGSLATRGEPPPLLFNY
ncbi:hypothetical protein Pcinc_007443 [Petrolisthes cinctipes]|uniref:Gamma-butyrobetaine hydroxylase-like N-terminal domain-containing protein n=1 Tax=Petrolisthes cinctipes TaxID=88211 RepID=A0AAE1KXE4_PETCI|nr:hypothetical protein Pcinc_007443 [Petrolisthes cinctipes]